MISLKFSFPIPFKWLIKCFLKIKNLLLRPKLILDVKLQTIVFMEKNNQEHHYQYFCLLVSNISNKDLHINPRQIKINNESYQFIIQMESNFLQLNPANNHWKDCKNDMYKIYRDNWLDISENRFTFVFKPYETKIFPMKLIQAASHIVTSIKKDSLLFDEKSKLSLTFEANKKIYEYGINRMYVYKRYINYLAFYRNID